MALAMRTATIAIPQMRPDRSTYRFTEYVEFPTAVRRDSRQGSVVDVVLQSFDLSYTDWAAHNFGRETVRLSASASGSKVAVTAEVTLRDENGDDEFSGRITALVVADLEDGAEAGSLEVRGAGTRTAGRGDYVYPPVSVRNVGAETVHSTTVTVTAPHGMTFEDGRLYLSDTVWFSGHLSSDRRTLTVRNVRLNLAPNATAWMWTGLVVDNASPGPHGVEYRVAEFSGQGTVQVV
ncbi:hypothetical protein [Streptomyces sp. URMC 123]|uniref:hypothetical protein n=1 Tax=Streptomyces sp. URMC 123 TaxID=3423403 RepID=UPI003F1C23A8